MNLLRLVELLKLFLYRKVNEFRCTTSACPEDMAINSRPTHLRYPLLVKTNRLICLNYIGGSLFYCKLGCVVIALDLLGFPRDAAA
jgi:hypothetical protein